MFNVDDLDELGGGATFPPLIRLNKLTQKFDGKVGFLFLFYTLRNIFIFILTNKIQLEINIF